MGKLFSFRTLLEAVDDTLLAVGPDPGLAVLPVLDPVVTLTRSMDKSLRLFFYA